MNIRKDQKLKDIEDYHARLDEMLNIIEEKNGHRRGSRQWTIEMDKLFPQMMKDNEIYESAKTTPADILYEEATTAMKQAIKEHYAHKRSRC